MHAPDTELITDVWQPPFSVTPHPSCPAALHCTSLQAVKPCLAHFELAAIYAKAVVDAAL